MGVIQTLWFKTVKRRRANASVVKSYMDLFQQRIPELLETVINLTDDEVCTYRKFRHLKIVNLENDIFFASKLSKTLITAIYKSS